MTAEESEDLLVAVVLALVCRLRPSDMAVVEACVRLAPRVRPTMRATLGRLINSRNPLLLARRTVEYYDEPHYNVPAS